MLVLNGCVSLPFLSGVNKTDSPPVTGVRQPATPAPSNEPPSPPGAGSTPSTSGIVLAAKTLHEAGEKPKYEIDARWPVLEWNGNPQVEVFNQAAERLVESMIMSFKEGLADFPEDPILHETYSSLEIDFLPTTDRGGIVAVLFQISSYSAGAAHPGHYSRSLNFDLRDGKVLAMEDVFIPGSGYLDKLASACLKDLKERQVLDWEEGALADPKNYQVWNITPDGILVTFDEYQVAPYAAGPQSVVVPYAVLAAVIRPGGPLREYVAP